MPPPATFSNDQFLRTPYSPSLRNVLSRLDNLIDWERQRRNANRGAQRLMRVDSKPCQILLQSLGNPQKKLQSVIHVTGSKGKGTVSAMITAGLRTMYPTASIMTYGSPHVERVNERIKINEVPVDDEELSKSLNESLNKQQESLNSNAATWFDVMTATSLVTASNLNVKYAIMEVGMGGRLDSTNVFDGAPIALITNIHLEHADIIGPTLKDIAYEKAGIIGTNTHTALVGMHQNDPLAYIFKAQVDSFHPKPNLKFMPPKLNDTLFDINLNLARAAINALILNDHNQSTHHFNQYDVLNETIARDALKRLPARQEIFHVLDNQSQKQINVLLDGAHVSDSVRTVLKEVSMNAPDVRIIAVVAVGRDKDVKGIAQAVVDCKNVSKVMATVTGIESPYLPADDLKVVFDEVIQTQPQQAGGDSITCTSENSAQQAVVNALSMAASDEHSHTEVVVIGSLHLAGRVRPLLGQLHAQAKLAKSDATQGLNETRVGS